MTRVIAHGSQRDGEAIPSYRPRIAVPFGGGLDRSTATLAASREVHRDLVNLLPREGKVRIRPGIASILPSLTTGSKVMDRIVAGAAYEAEYTNVVVGYHEASSELHVFRVSTDGSVVSHVGFWGTTSNPRVILAEFQNRMFMAHDERVPTLRLTTHYWDPFTASLRPLEAAWDPTEGAGLEPLRFRGVAVHLDYLVGWGYGSEAEDRPDLVRTSLPGLAVHEDTGEAAFDIGHYAAVGNPADPVTLCAPAGNALMVCKDSKVYPFTGFSPASFGIGPSNELRFGVEHAHLGIAHAGELYLWTDEGPRMTNGGPLRDLELPLDIAGPSPADLAEAGELKDGFVVYIPVQRTLLWVFGRRGYALSLRQPQAGLRWSYWEFGVAPGFGWYTYTSTALATTPSVGHPEWRSSTTTSSGATVTVANVGHSGDEYLELWLRPEGGEWTLAHNAKVRLDATQPVSLTGLDSGVAYTGALRYRRGAGLYDPAYEGDPTDPLFDPSVEWPAVSVGNFTTGLAGVGTTTAGWERTSLTSEQINLAFAGMDPAAEIRVERKKYGEDDSAYVLLTDPNLAAGTVGYSDVGLPDGEVYYNYRITEVRAGLTRSHVIKRWAGPDAPTGLYQDLGPYRDWDESYWENWYQYMLRWTTGHAGAETVIKDDYYCFGTFVERVVAPAGSQYSGIVSLEHEADPPQEDYGNNYTDAPFNIRVWHRLTSTYGMDTIQDFSPMLSFTPTVRIEPGEPAMNSCGTGGTGTVGGGGEPKDPVLRE